MNLHHARQGRGKPSTNLSSHELRKWVRPLLIQSKPNALPPPPASPASLTPPITAR